ncbi:MAG TPA: L-type lectin-domain containing protein, partial [Flavisolibacter sp.]|nr:L-type lectin-domain containing protein [Flavisolibacter sp.]
MKFFCKQLLLAAFLLFFKCSLFAQYILNGSAQKNSCNCYTLTQPAQMQSGSVWNGNKINLNNSFDFWFNVFLGCNDATGADGIVFILQPISTSIGTVGEGMGFSGVSPSIGIALDTYQNFNLNDPAYDHISIQANGVVNHTNDLAGPVPISSLGSNVEDCQWHKLRITWEAGT